VKRSTARRGYRLRNWREYNAALMKRGSLTLWVSEEARFGWHDGARRRKRGASLRNFPNATGLLQTVALTCARKYSSLTTRRKAERLLSARLTK
jgi:hypothetical protein